jgi:hypothetical protein
LNRLRRRDARNVRLLVDLHQAFGLAGNGIGFVLFIATCEEWKKCDVAKIGYAFH